MKHKMHEASSALWIEGVKTQSGLVQTNRKNELLRKPHHDNHSCHTEDWTQKTQEVKLKLRFQDSSISLEARFQPHCIWEILC